MDISDSPLYAQVIAWPNLLSAYRQAAKGKRGKQSAAAFEHQLADRLLQLQRELTDFSYQPGALHDSRSQTAQDQRRAFS